MPSRRFDWHERIKAVENEYKSVRVAVDRLKRELARDPTILIDEPPAASLGAADENLEGTYFVRLFAEFESALRSYERARRGDSTLKTDASTLIDSIGGRRGQGISDKVRRGAHAVRLVRNHWAHERDAEPRLMTIAGARARLQTFLSWLPAEWG